jgi:hypothetical protein
LYSSLQAACLRDTVQLIFAAIQELSQEAEEAAEAALAHAAAMNPRPSSADQVRNARGFH